MAGTCYASVGEGTAISTSVSTASADNLCNRMHDIRIPRNVPTPIRYSVPAPDADDDRDAMRLPV